MPRAPRLLWKDPLIWAMLVTLAMCLFGVGWTFYMIATRINMNSLREQAFAVRLMQVTLGMVIGLATTFFGIIAAWFGVTETAGAELDSTNVRGKLAAAGPGAVLVICGTFLTYICIQKDFVIEESTPVPEIRTDEPLPS